MTPEKEETTRMTEMLAQANWFAIQAKPHREDLAAASLDTLELEVFLPKIRQEHFLFGKTCLLVGPLFRGYLFARLCPVVSLAAACHARGVLRVLGNSHGPIPVAPEIVSEIQGRVQADGFFRLEPAALRRGQRVTIEQGPLEGLMGRVEQESDDGKRVAILLEAINKARVLIEKRWLAPAAGL